MTNRYAVAKELLKRRKLVSSESIFSLDSFLFKEQLDFVTDPSPTKIAVCSRRAGKTTACAADLVFTAVTNPEVVCLYITLSRTNAKRLVWREIKKINREYYLGGVENLSELSVTFPNGSIIYLSGAKDTSECEKFRGLALKLVYVDEAQSFREFIQDLINDILSPALMDYAGTLVLIGTPPPIPVGYFCKQFQDQDNGWSKHAWSFWNNPFVAEKSKHTHQELLERELKRRGVTAEDPSIQREWFGKFTLDTDSLLIHYLKDRNHYDQRPLYKTPYSYIMGIDLGFSDADAIAILAWHEDTPITYLVEELVVPNQGLTELVNQIQEFEKKYDISKMVIDEGGLGKKLAEEMRRRHSIPVQPADKARKIEAIAFMNDALKTGRFMAKSDSRFVHDSYLVEIDRDKSTPTKVVVSDKFHSDVCDAVLYAFRESPSFAYEAPIIKPKEGTQEWYKAQEDEMWSNTVEQMRKQQKGDDPWSGLL